MSLPRPDSSSPSAEPPTAAIVGRPNVGKSTLFNRLAGRRLALVDDQPGVTRDRRVGHARLGDLELEIVDTAGFEEAGGEALEARMSRGAEAAAAEADVVLLVIDARAGVLGADEVFARRLRRSGKPVVLVANKSEGRAGDSTLGEAWGLGLGEPVAISAAHGEGLADLYAAIRARLGEGGEAQPEAAPLAEQGPPVRIAIVGRPNAGKSTLVNALIGEARMLTGPEAGITRDAIAVDWTWRGRAFRLVDTAGLRRKARVEAGLERLAVADALRALGLAEVVVLVMDATHPFETQDLQIADLTSREGRALVFVLAKWDLIEDRQEALAAARDAMRRLSAAMGSAPLVVLSAEAGEGLESLMEAVQAAHADWSARIPTGELNAWLRLAVARHPPPADRGRPVKLKYITQVKARPPTFILFAGRAATVPASYQRYLSTSLAESFGLAGAPLRLRLRQAANPYAGRASGRLRKSSRANRGTSAVARRPRDRGGSPGR